MQPSSSSPSSSPAPTVLWRPNPGPQSRFLASRVDEVLYGGAAGGGKSAAAIAAPLRFVSNPTFNALVLRRETPQLADLIEKSTALYPKLGAKLNLTTGLWRFPSGARVWFTHCEHENDVERFDGHEFQLVVFDELTHFTERQYTRIRARIRGTDLALPRWTRATTNPGGPGHEWVFARFGAWLDPKHPRPAAPGEPRAFLDREEVAEGTPASLTRTFIPALLKDNPHVGPEYEAQLRDLDPVRRAQLLGGDWLAKPAKGLYFKRHWFGVREAPHPAPLRRVRYWDRAATLEGDWTVGVLLAEIDDGYVVEDVARFRGTPREVKNTIRRTAELDGPSVQQVLEQDPGQAGVVERDDYAEELDGIGFTFVRPTGDKVTRAGPFSAQVESGRVSLVRAEWNRAYLDELEAFPEGTNDDQVDASSGAHASIGLAGTAQYTRSASRGRRLRL